MRGVQIRPSPSKNTEVKGKAISWQSQQAINMLSMRYNLSQLLKFRKDKVDVPFSQSLSFVDNYTANMLSGVLKQGDDTLFVSHQNPNATVISTLSSYEGHTAKDVYEGVSFMRAHAPREGDEIKIIFGDRGYYYPKRVKKVYVKTGNARYPRALLKHAALEVLTDQNEPDIYKTMGGLIHLNLRKTKRRRDYQRIATFDENGAASKELENWDETIVEIVIRVLSDSDNEIVISEILVETDKSSQ